MKASEAQEAIARGLQVAGLLVFVVTLYLARDILIPIALGVLVAFVLNPLVGRLQRWGLSNTTAVLTAATLVFCLVGMFIVSIGSSVSGFSDELPNYRAEMKRKMENARSLFGGLGRQLQELTMAAESDSSPEKPSVESAEAGADTSEGDGEDQNAQTDKKNDGSSPTNPLYVVQKENRGVSLQSWAGSAAVILGPLGTAGLVIVFSLFALLYRDDLRDRFVSVISRGKYVVTTEALNEASQRIGKYLIAQLILNFAYGVAFAFALLVIGYFFTVQGWFPYVALLGTMAGIVRFIPYVGPLIGAGLPLALSVLLFPGFSVVTAVLIVIIVMELVFNNVLEPLLYGSSTGVSPMAVILAAVFWGWLWGPIGLLLATPLTVCAVVLGQYVPRFRFLSTLLSDEIQVKASVRAYQRLLRGEKTSIAEFLQKQSEFLQKQSKAIDSAEVIDDVLVPTVKLIAADKEQRALSDEQMMNLLRAGAIEAGLIAPENVEGDDDLDSDSGSSGKSPVSEKSGEPQKLIVAIPVRHIGEQLVIEAVGKAVGDTMRFTVFENDDLPDRDAQKVVDLQPHIIVIAVIPPGGLEQARYWCSAIRKAGYRGEIVVACLGKFRHFDRLLQGFRRRGASQLVTSAKQLAQKVQRLASKDVFPKRTVRELSSSINAASVASNFNSQPLTVID
jgi:predicted PurR-regulated permease PerM